MGRGVLSIQSREIIQGMDIAGDRLREVNIGKEAFEVGADEVKGGLKKVAGGMKVREGDDGGIPCNGNASRGTNESTATMSQPAKGGIEWNET